ncbi:amino acid adenylation domain-containing protein [Kitasatospora sp. NPDC058046]|uniref:amino acid adenylation domain-containing protein n=1 Tax=Kitasatospora sp. NPDC058046 TaxID=3346312 RepID=UPI0036D7A745
MSALTRLITAAARTRPDAPAVDDGERPWAWERLDAETHAFAAALLRAGFTDGPLLLAAAPGPAWVTALLGAWRSGAVAVPLDAGHPPARLARIAAGCRARAAVTADGTTPHWAPALPTIAAGARAAGNLPEVPDDATACLFHTSGSTGTPKPVVLSHRALAERTREMPAAAGLTVTDRIAQFTSPAFDAVLWEVLCALATGATLVTAPTPARTPGPALTRWLAEQRITALTCTPSQLAATPAPDAGLPDLRLLVLGGEALHLRPLTAWFTPGRRIANAYGPTEAGIEAFLAPDIGPHNDPVPIGWPLPGVVPLVLDHDDQPVPDGEAGELHLAGTGLADGYLHRPEATAAAFPTVTDPATGRPVRAYRTGDRVRRLPDGQYTFLGRTDRQLNLHGVRLEPGEIEARSVDHPEVRTAAAVLDPDRQQITLHAETTTGLTPAALRRHLADHLPPAAVPARITCRPALPRTAGGKIDRRALAAEPTDPNPPPGPPGTVLPEPLATWWHTATGTPASAGGDFYIAGGDSLGALALLARLNEHYDTDLTIGAFTADPTAEHLLRTIERRSR